LRGPISHPYGNEIGTSHARAEAGYGFVKGLSAVSIENGGTIVAQESSIFSLDNIRISGPSGTAAGTIVNYSLNIGINGGLDVGATTDYAGTATVQLNYSSGSSLGGGGAQLGSASYSTVNGFTAGGVFAGLTAGDLNSNLAGVTPTRQARANDLITVSLLLSTTALAGHINFAPNPAGSAYATSFFADTVMFSTAGPVFNFDLAGWTANSDDGCIVNNQFMCAPAAAAVPEPATFLIVLSGLGALIWLIRRIHRI
jgi:hypothetical protein